MSQIVDGIADGRKSGRIEGPELDRRIEVLRQRAGHQEPIGYLTSGYLAALWDERCQEVDAHRHAHGDDLRGIELRQRRAMQALQAYRLLSELERQLGFEVALPVLGPRREPNGRVETKEDSDLID
ncbi:MAG TPA: hypothetical protein VFZ25_11030 [Chloroflexota bacterium]|nr:hypothetical protein [Chloroflexota bacterium]